MDGALSVTIGIVGAGSMGGSIARGLVDAGVVAPGRLLVADHESE